MKKKIIFICPAYSTFIKNDYNLLQKHYNLTKFHFKPSKNLFKMLFQFLKQFLFLIINIWRFDAVYIWFADYHSLMPVLFSYLTGKKSVLVIGGYDVCRIPDIKYGAFYSNFRGWFTAKSMKLASINITVSKNVSRKTKVIAPYTNRKLIYNGVNLLPDDSNQQKENIVLTVAIIAREQTFYIKGIDIYLSDASLFLEFYSTTTTFFGVFAFTRSTTASTDPEVMNGCTWSWDVVGIDIKNQVGAQPPFCFHLFFWTFIISA